MRMNMASSRNSEGNQMILRGSANQNSSGGLVSSSIEQATSEDQPPPHVLENLNSDTSDDEFPKPDVENQENLDDDHNEITEDFADSNLGKRKRNHRHSPHQIRVMENFYQKYPRPSKNQRQHLADELGLDPLQVKFWFQNKRTQMKAQQERNDNNKLRAENDKLRTENMKLKQSSYINSCSCASLEPVEMSPEQRMLRLENAQLTKEMERVMAITKNAFVNLNKTSMRFMTPTPLLAEFGRSSMNTPPQGSAFCDTQPIRPMNDSLVIPNLSLIAQLALSAMDEVTAMATLGEPLWTLPPSGDSLLLDEQEYSRIFQRGFSTKPQGYRTEASRESTIIMMETANVVGIFMDLAKWLTVFASIISRGTILEVLSPGVDAGNYDGAMLAMFAEFQVLSPVVPTRDCIFIRYCKRVTEETWEVVDVSFDTFLRNGSIAKCQKRPSGCVIQAMPNGYSKITWIEHVEVQDEMTQNLSKPIISSEYAYGAKRWISILERQCERVAAASGQTNISHHCPLNGIALANPIGRQKIFKLADRMVLKFCAGVSAPYSDYPWKILSGNGIDQVRIMTKMVNNNVPMAKKSIVGAGDGSTVISASSCFWVPILPKDVFNFLRNESTRPEWDVLTNGCGEVQEIACINNGTDSGSCVSVLGVHNQGNTLILQESSIEPTTSFIIYAPVDPISFIKIFDGGNLDELQLLPSGFTILPSNGSHRHPNMNVAVASSSSRSRGSRGNNSGNAVVNGSLVTFQFQLDVGDASHAKVSSAAVNMVSDLVESTTQKIKVALGVN